MAGEEIEAVGTGGSGVGLDGRGTNVGFADSGSRAAEDELAQSILMGAFLHQVSIFDVRKAVFRLSNLIQR
jgi:hypothetical protein